MQYIQVLHSKLPIHNLAITIIVSGSNTPVIVAILTVQMHMFVVHTYSASQA